MEVAPQPSPAWYHEHDYLYGPRRVDHVWPACRALLLRHCPVGDGDHLCALERGHGGAHRCPLCGADWSVHR